MTLFTDMRWKEHKFIIHISEDLLLYDPTKGSQFYFIYLCMRD
jgi:hypothetical protein